MFKSIASAALILVACTAAVGLVDQAFAVGPRSAAAEKYEDRRKPLPRHRKRAYTTVHNHFHADESDIALTSGVSGAYILAGIIAAGIAVVSL